MPTFRAATADRECRVLEAMTPGAAYEARELAAATGLTIQVVRHILERSARDGQVMRIEPIWRGLSVNWRRG